MKKAGVIIGVIVLCLVFPGSVFALDIVESNVVRLVNEERGKMGLERLYIDKNLTLAAKAKAEDMIGNQYWEHFHAGKSPWDWMEENGYFYLDAGENLAIDFNNAEKMHEAWMDSSTHRANIINSKYSEIGIGIAEGYFEDHETIIVVQMFGNPDTEVSGEVKSLSDVDLEVLKEQEDAINALIETEISLQVGSEEEEGFIGWTKRIVSRGLLSGIDKINHYLSATAETKQ